MRLQDVAEGRLYNLIFSLGLSVIFVLLDYLNPFLDFHRTWNMHYVVNNLGWFMISLVPIFFFLGFIAEFGDLSGLFFASILIPIYYYILKGLLFLCLIAQDPNLPHVIGAWYGGYILDWRDFSVVYFFSLPLFMLFVWRYCFGFLALGYIASHFFGRSIRRLAGSILSRLSRGSGDGQDKVLVV